MGLWDSIWDYTPINPNNKIISGVKDTLFPSKKAAGVQAVAAERALAETGRRYEEGKGYISPYAQQGLSDYQNFGNMVRGGQFDYKPEDYQDPNFNFEADPGYQFRQQEGNKALLGAASAQGHMLSGATMKAMQKYNQGLASQEYGNAYNRFTGNRDYLRNKYTSDRSFGYGQQADRYNRFANLANVGYGAAGQLGNMAIGQGTDTANIMGQQGNAQAAGIMGNQQDLLSLANLLGKIYGAGQMGGGSGNNFSGTNPGNMQITDDRIFG